MIKSKLRYFSNHPRIAANTTGSGEAVFFLHGVGTTKSSWDAQLDHFRSTHFSIAWDARGYGESEDYEGTLSFASDFVSDLSRILDELNISTVHLVGLSMGGLIAQCFYFANPQRVASLVLAHTFPSFPALGNGFVSQFRATRLQPLLDGDTPQTSAEATVRGLMAPEASNEARDRFRDALNTLRREPYIKTLQGLLSQEAPGRLDNIAVPTLVLTGEQDPLGTPALARQMAQRIPGSELHIIPQCGHLSNLEQPDELNAVLGDFLKRHAGRATRRSA